MTHVAADDLARKLFGKDARAVLRKPGEKRYCIATYDHSAGVGNTCTAENAWHKTQQIIGQGQSWQEAIQDAKRRLKCSPSLS